MGGTGAGEVHSLTILEHYQGIPIYLLDYPQPTIMDRSIHQREIEKIATLPDPQFALVINCKNLSSSENYTTQELVELYQSALLSNLRGRLLAIARYSPGSLTSMIRSMLAHVYARQGISAGFSSDQETSLRAVRRLIDRRLAPPPA
jgi:hypothetical protein